MKIRVFSFLARTRALPPETALRGQGRRRWSSVSKLGLRQRRPCRRGGGAIQGPSLPQFTHVDGPVGSKHLIPNAL